MSVAYDFHSFKTCALEEMDSVKLMTRSDSKYLLSDTQLFHLLEFLVVEHALLKIGEIVQQDYQTLYLDTADKRLYMDHCNFRESRHKVRIRKYLSTGVAYLEVKHKRTEIGTSKVRQNWMLAFPQTCQNWSGFDEGSLNFLHDQKLDHRMNISDLAPVMFTNFSRLTFVDFVHQVRLTLDLNLVCGEVTDQVREFRGISILEVKRQKGGTPPPVIEYLRSQGIKKSSWSKYCMACALTIPGIKANKFKAQKVLMNKLGGVIYG